MNIIVVITDSLRVDHVGCYGSHVKTPNIDRLAEQGMRFDRAYMPSGVCSATRLDGGQEPVGERLQAGLRDLRPRPL